VNDDAVFDIAVIGGGLVGTPLSVMLSQCGWSVALIDKQPPNTALLPGTRGFTALSHSTVEMLKTHGMWDELTAAASAIKKVHVSHKDYFGATRISSEQQKVSALGFVVDNALYLNSLQSPLSASSVKKTNDATVERVQYGANEATLHIKTNSEKQSLRARLVIAVDGVTSTVRESAGIGTTQTDYHQVGVLGEISFDKNHEHVAYERFTPSGPLAMLPRPGNNASYVYCIDPEKQAELEIMSDADFMAHMQDMFGYRLGRFESVTKRIFVPLLRIEATASVADRLLLMGNSLRLLHPVAGQGYNLAMRDAKMLTDRLTDQTIDPGASGLLKEFAESRQADHQAVVRLTDTLARSFRGSASLPSHLRALGLIGLDVFPLARNSFTRRSMGYSS